MFKVGDEVVIDNINGEVDTFHVGNNGTYTVSTGDTGVVVEIHDNESYNVNVRLKDGKLLAFRSSELKIDTGERKFTMCLSAENDYYKEIEMTYAEALIVDRVLKELNKNSKGYCGHCSINLE